MKRNDIVAVFARVGGISVRRYCKCHDDGAKGQFVMLTPVDGKAKLTARVTGFREAEIVIEDYTAAVQKNPPRSALENIKSNQRTSNPISQVSQQQTVSYNTPMRSQSASSPTNVIQANRNLSSSFRRSKNHQNRSRFNVKILANRPVQLPQR